MQHLVPHINSKRPAQMKSHLLAKVSIFIHIAGVTVWPLQVKSLSKVILCTAQGLLNQAFRRAISVQNPQCSHSHPGV